MGFDPSKMDVIDRRRIEAMVLGPMLRAFQVEFGVEKTNEIATGVITKLAREQGSEFAKGIGANGLEDYAANKDAWRRHGALEIDIVENDSKIISKLGRLGTCALLSNVGAFGAAQKLY